MDRFWTCPWTGFGQVDGQVLDMSMDRFWTCLWTGFGHVMDRIWTCYGQVFDMKFDTYSEKTHVRIDQRAG